MCKALLPFWLYWGVLVCGCLLIFLCPLLLFLILAMALLLVPVWLIIVYLVGNAVQRRSYLNRPDKRIALSFFCSLLTVLIFPVCSEIYDIIQWRTFHLSSFTAAFRDPVFRILFALHFFAFWTGEEMGRLAEKAEQEQD